ncbi:MAG: T9SS type A sorting domain-containing protein, partial [Dolichospermum sp.]
KEYGINLSQFKSSKFNDVINANDIVAVNFSFSNSRGVSTTMNINLSKARFTNSVIASAIEVLTLGVYPNPSNGRFTTKFTSEVAMPLVLKVIETSTGRIVKTQFINAAKGINQVEVTMDNSISASGSYIVTLEGDNIKYNATKLLVNK